jgi:hypothetical protein
MNTLLDDARGLLEVAGYATHAAQPDAPLLYFEDECLLGFVRVFDDSNQIVSGWRAEQDSFLRRNGSTLLRAPIKAWNLYAVLLTRAGSSEEVTRALLGIEEDFQSTRKIARGGIRTREELALVLGPLLPLQAIVSLARADVHNRLLERLGPEGSPRRLLLSDAHPEDIARLLTEEP